MDSEAFIEFIVDYTVRVLAYTGGQFLLIFGPAFLFGFLTQFLSEKIRCCGWTGLGNCYTYLTAPGTVVHECGHALFVLLFGYKVNKFVPFNPDGNTLGYVSWSAPGGDCLRFRLAQFFVGTGPIWLGSAVIALLAFLVLGKEGLGDLGLTIAHEQDFSSIKEVTEYVIMVGDSGLRLFFSLFSLEILKHPLMLLCLYLIFCVGGHMKLSPPDMQSMKSGVFFLLLPIFFFNVLTAWQGDLPMKITYAITQYNHVLYALLVFVLLLLLVVWGLTILLGSLKKR